MIKNFWKKVIWIGLPVALQNLINVLLNMVDTLMIESLGEDFLSSVGLANKIFFVLNLLVFGIVSGCSILQSQYYGNGDHKGLNKVFGLSAILAICAGILFFFAALFIPNELMKIFTNSPDLIEIGASYLRIVATSYIFMALSMAITGLLKSINKTRAPMLITLGSVIINVCINYVFIFGAFGAPRLEADGAALGTLISRFIEVLILIIYLKYSNKGFDLSLRDMISLNKRFVKKAILLALPVIFNELMWGVGTTIYSVIYGHMGDEVVAVMTVSQVLQDLVHAFLFGISSACAVIVGNELGANNLDKAKEVARRLLLANFIFAFILAIVLISLINPYLSFYTKISPQVKENCKYVCIVYAIFLPFKSFNLTNICGVLRSGGDTKFCLALDVLGVWAVGIPCGVISAFLFSLSIPFVFAFICLEEFVKIIFGFVRYKKYKWVKNITFVAE